MSFLYPVAMPIPGEIPREIPRAFLQVLKQHRTSWGKHRAETRRPVSNPEDPCCPASPLLPTLLLSPGYGLPPLQGLACAGH